MTEILNSESTLIGAILMRPGILNQVRADVQPDHFMGQKTRDIYEAILGLADDRVVIEPSSVMDALAKKKKDYKAELISIIENVATSADWKYHAGRVRDANKRRDLLAISDIIRGGLQEKRDVAEISSEIRKSLLAIDQDENLRDVIDLRTLLPQVLDSIEKGRAAGVPSGIHLLDQRAGGFAGGELIVVAGRPGMGKSVLAKDFAEAAGVPVLYFSLEMSNFELIKRQIASHSGIDYTDIRRSKVPSNRYGDLLKAADKLASKEIHYVESTGMTIDGIVSAAESWKVSHNIGMVVIDYLQLIRTASKSESRQIEVASMSRRLKCLARDLDIPVICLAQLNRSCEARTNKRPMLSDLRESGAIEQDADMVFFVYREHVYTETAPEMEAELILEKSRNTDTWIFPLLFDGPHQAFLNPAPDYLQEVA